MWKLKQKLWPKKAPSLPVAKQSHGWRLVSAPGEIRKLLLKEYKISLRPRPLLPGMKLLKIIKQHVISMKIRQTILNQERPEIQKG